MRKEELRTPCYIVQKEKLEENLRILKRLREETGCKILLAQKAFSMYFLYPFIGKYLDGERKPHLLPGLQGRRI